MEAVTCKAPINMAVIKYWGKRDEKLILPLNDSISVTLSCDMIYAKTTVAASPSFTEDKIWLNGREESISNVRVTNCLSKLRELAKKSDNPKTKSMLDWKIHIVSRNNFPTAAGLASSAAGYACLVYTLAHLFDIKGELTSIARRGSGSACRSLYGGFVIWKMGKENDGSDSLAKQIVPASHWKEMKIMVLVVSGTAKEVGSSVAMQRSVETSEYLKKACTQVTEERVNEMTQAILNRDFETFARITMQDSNRLHSVCLDSYPPVRYMNDTSHYIVQMVHLLNDYFGKIKVAYSFDAGPNACLFLLEENVPLILSIVNHFFPPNKNRNEEPYFQGPKVDVQAPPSEVIKAIPLTPNPMGTLENIIYLSVGNGPEVLGENESLIDNKGFPKYLK